MLKFIALSGTTDVTQNLYIYEYGDDIIILDCGVGFPDPDMYGVDLVIPDFEYVRKNRHKLRGVVITHGHEDHIGALPFLLKEINVPVYATKLTLGFIKEKLEDAGVNGVKMVEVNPERDSVAIGVFKVTPFRISHSVPDAVGYCIETPEGKLFHVPDYKFDWTPVDGKPFDISKAALLSADGALALASDCLGATSPGHTQSEKAIEGIIEKIIGESEGLIYFTTISSNISRIKQCLRASKKHGRKVCFIGRSIIRKAEIARELGYLHYDRDMVIPAKTAKRMNKDKVLYVISGSYGQPGSALYRVAIGEHDALAVSENDTVIFSGDPAPPGSKVNVDFVVDRLIELGVNVHYYDMQEDLHVSGHGSQEDIKTLIGLIKPKYCIPIGGTIRHMRAFRDIAMDMGKKSNEILELSAGDVIEFKNQNANFGKKIPVHDVLVDGLEVGEIGNIVLRDRKILATDGVAMVVIHLDTESQRITQIPEIITRGFVFEKNKKDLLKKSAAKVHKMLNDKKIVNSHVIKQETGDFLEKLFYRETGRQPMIVPVVIEI